VTGEQTDFVVPVKAGFDIDEAIDALHRRNWKALERFLRDAKITASRIADNTITGDQIAPGTIGESELDPSLVTDNIAPGSSPTPTVLGGVGFFLLRWPVSGNADPVVHEVHISTTTGFTPDATTLAGVSGVDATFFFVRAMPDGSALVQGTTYFFKTIETDNDGSAAASAQGSGVMAKVGQPDIAVNSIIAGMIVAGEITADKLNISTLSAITANLGTVTAGTLKTAASGTRWEISSAIANTIYGYLTGVTNPGEIQIGSASRLNLRSPWETGEDPAEIEVRGGSDATKAVVLAPGDLSSLDIFAGEVVLLDGCNARGYCAVRAYNDNATARAFGAGVTYGGVSRMETAPTSIAFTLVGTDSGIGTPFAENIDDNGFLFRMTVDGNSVGSGSRSYATVY
jgi:hypothetical protein